MKIQITLAEYRKLSDEELIHRFVHRSEPETIHVLFERYGHLVLGVCNKHLNDPAQAADAMQKIFLRLLDDLKRFKIENFKEWLLKDATDYCLQKKGLKKAEPTPIVELGLRFSEKPLTDEKIKNALEKLPESERSCLEMFYLKKMTYEEIAAAKQMKIRDVKERLQKGRQELLLKIELLEGVS
jgi:RNA polymerase sigma-70 factor (ECF subfamily)